MKTFNKLIYSIRRKYTDSKSLNNHIGYISKLPEVKRLSILLSNVDLNKNIYDLLVAVGDDPEDDFVISALLLALIDSKADHSGFALIISNYEELYPLSTMIARSFILSRSLQ